MSFLSRRTTYCLLGLISLLLQGGCATEQGKKSVLWHSRDQFVALVDRDDQGGERQGANQQPVSLSTPKLSAELASLTVKYPGDAKVKRLFEDEAVKTLTEQMHDALQKAGPEQDVVFAVYGKNPLLKGWASEEVVTTGRAFYRDNALNLLLGMVREQVKETDRRLQPFVTASRKVAAPMPGAISTTSGKIAANRPDWIILPVGQATAEELAAPPQVEEQAAPLLAPFKAPGPAPAPAPAAKSIEERLKVLGELKAKGLITEEEYRAKKESILKEL